MTSSKCSVRLSMKRLIHCNCASSGTTKATARLIDANNKQFGIVVLKFSSVCKTAWAKMTLDKAVP
jgi:hypothetical protein